MNMKLQGGSSRLLSSGLGSTLSRQSRRSPSRCRLQVWTRSIWIQFGTRKKRRAWGRCLLVAL